ncbi:hypothetical protein CC1G_08350 [Coprinopsis cinerea okayama7|uniref:Uncharacterized protein n=1 Tax=Coprinopsis cinerea (strain Okayama-7 / 130 / ATCC MYA-4618 / FGSC 9003) TaxID=240176 RepID=A8NA94_COPC7|nr:hypothetical protein CC1G_08350 [Coprinopsis cinerea okayama7\|eukprot:XP_001831746.2 hypothetical protein CC1G_08350 [Coprinopsis cinerea okayama7\
MRIQPLFTTTFLFSTFLTSYAALFTIQDLMKHSGLTTPGPSEYNEEGYKILNKLRKMLPTKTKSRPQMRMTNAERLRKKLPLNPPVRRDGSRRVAPRQASPLPPVVTEGGAGVFDENGDLIGYVSASLSPSGQMVMTTDENDVLSFVTAYQPPVAGVSDFARITMANPDFPIVGAIQGRDNSDASIGPGSPNYLYVGGVELPGTVPESPGEEIGNTYTDATGIDRLVQTDIWQVQTATGMVMARWVNPDGSIVNANAYMQGNNIYLLGDPDAFQAVYPDPIEPISIRVLQV